MNTILLRKQALDATKGAWFQSVYEWGKSDCAILIDAHLKNVGFDSGYSQFRKYTTEADAHGALKARGYADTADWMDALGLPRINRARAIAGDVWGYPSACGMTALVVYMGSDKVLAYHPNATATPRLHVVAVVIPPSICWSVTSCLRSS